MKGRCDIGTNYYYFKERVTEETDLHEGTHIGKNSAGWVFHFEAHPNLKTVEDYKKLLKNGVIYDEYEREIPYDEFWNIVKSSKEEDHFGKPWSFSNLPENENRDTCFDDWQDEGYDFTNVEFF